MPRDRSKKPTKPYADFPLTAHANGQWCKKIRQRVHFFGVWGDPDAALAKYLDQRDDLQAGRTPRQPGDNRLTVRELCNLYLGQAESKVKTGTLSPRTWVDYRNCCRQIIDSLGRSVTGEGVRNGGFESFNMRAMNAPPLNRL